MATYRGKKLTPIEDAALEVLVNKLAPNPEDYRVGDEVNEAVHPMGVHVTSVPGKKVEGLPAYKVTKVGSKVKEHGGIKVGEHLHDNHIDDLADMGHKIKTEETTTKKEKTMKDQNQSKSLAELAAETISMQNEGAFKSMVTDKMTSGKGMSYNRAMKAAQSDLDKGKNIPKTKMAAPKIKEDNHEMGHDVKSKKRMAQAKKNIKDVDKVDDLDGVKEDLSTEEVQFDQEADFTFVEHNTWDIQIAEEYTYEDFMKAAIAVTDGADNAIEIAEDYFNAGDITIILEEFTRSDINDKIDTHKKAGSKVTDPKYTTKDDKLHAEFTVTDKKGMRKRHVFHGNIRRHESLGKVAVSPDKD